jgi:two-component system, cell cycle sensor histidine kinase and response regulator CckA
MNATLDYSEPNPGSLNGDPAVRESNQSFSAEEIQDYVHDLNLAERKLSEEELIDSEARYRRLFEAAQDGILILDEQTGLIVDVNPFMVKLLDYSREEYIGMALWDIGLFEDIGFSKIAFRELKAKEYVRYEDLPLKTKGGRTVSAEFVSNVYRVNGKKVIQCNIRDITQRKHTEQSVERIQQAQKMESIGQLAGGIAHDFNNLLGVILGYCEILEGQPELPEPTCKMVQEIHNAGSLAASFTQRLLAFSRRQVLQPVVMDLNAVVNRATSMLGGMIGDNIDLVSVLSADLGTIKADPGQVEQVLMNLAINSRDAMPQGGKIIFETANMDVDEAFAEQHPLTKPGPYVMLTVSDTGIGMDKQTRAHIFEPFFSTKEIGKGTGLGLATVFGIVSQCVGSIDVYSEPGLGTTFKIYFPRCGEVAAVLQSATADPLRGGTETILLVDDSTPLRSLTRRLLEDCGYKVLDAGNAEQAIRLSLEQTEVLPLMITDVVMPGLSGPDLAEKLAIVRPEMKVLYTSGYADDALAQHGMLGTGYSFLEKPFTRDALIEKVRELLDAPVLPAT